VLPIERPQKIICIGLNYRDHAEEQGGELPDRPLLFAKWPEHADRLASKSMIPRSRRRWTTRPKLGVVIGSRVSKVSAENALEAVAGYVCVR
jgi:2-keto-4-pentenoate hydratase/2-oxohepta-3-ene-1,7-dioic acid hydratase in catechol pathway